MNKIKILFCAVALASMVPAVSRAAISRYYTFSTIAGSTNAGSNNGTNSGAGFNNPTGVAVDSSGNIYVADQKNNAIREIVSSGTNWIVSTIAGGNKGTNDGTNLTAQFYYPSGIAVDTGHNLYVADLGNDTVRKITPSGTNWVVSTIAGLGGNSGLVNASNSNARFSSPLGITVDGSGNLFVADELNNAIREIVPSGTNWVVSTIAGGTQGSANGSNSAAQFYYPAGVTVDAYERVYVGDRFNNEIRMVSQSGTNWVVTNIVGTTTAGFANGIGNSAGFYEPLGICIDSSSNLYLGDSGNSAVREVSPNGAVWSASILGGNQILGANNGVSNAAEFNTPFGVAVDSSGNVYVADSANNEIRIGIPSNGVIQTGSLEVSFLPTNVIPLGAAWQADEGPWQTNGATVTNLDPGQYTLTFTNISNYANPGPLTITVTAGQTNNVSVTYTLTNIIPNYTITASVSPSTSDGSVAGAGTYASGTATNLTATASNGFEFIGWTGVGTGTNNPLPVTVTGNGNFIANFAVPGTITFSVITSGSGTVTPNLNGESLKPGKSYTLTAHPDKGYLFSNWTGTITSDKSALTIKAESSLALQANFVLNPYPALAGVYNGLFYTTNGVTVQTAGMLRNLAVNTSGGYSGTVMIDGSGHGIGGKLSLGGQGSNRISLPNIDGGPVELSMSINSSASPPVLTGTVSPVSGAWVANLTAYLGANVLPVSQYTMLLEPDGSNAPPTDSPGGDGYALINNKGRITISGALADGTGISQSVIVSQEGYVPIYNNLYGGAGLLLGWINLETNVDGVGLTWIHPARKTGLYRSGFVNVLNNNQILISAWTNPPPTLGLFTNLSVQSLIGGTNGANYPVSITSKYKITGTDISGTVNQKTGYFQVSIGTGRDKITGNGALLPNTTYGAGYYINNAAGEAEAIELNP